MQSARVRQRRYVKNQGHEMMSVPYLPRFRRGWSRAQLASNQEPRLRQSLELVKECEDTMDCCDVTSEEQERANVAALRAMINTMIDGPHGMDVEVTDSEGEEEPGVPQSTSTAVVAGPAKPHVEQDFRPGAIKDTVLARVDEESSQASDGRPFSR
ncbi:hypothetical protein LTR10_000169 [Elasticomyces elasticus]|nr:hypothetical protein LTR10_000169 [Elasticomyces elasticus]KAK4980572.1 hypothetical protein LTR42_000880 [Elasticomyces elasticus]